MNLSQYHFRYQKLIRFHLNRLAGYRLEVTDKKFIRHGRSLRNDNQREFLKVMKSTQESISYSCKLEESGDENVLLTSK